MTTTGPAVTLADGQLSAIYLAADKVSGAGQRRTKNLVRTELIALIVASAAGVTTLRVGEYDILAVVSALAFIVAMSATVTRALSKPEEDWYEGRAAAESARTLAWKFAMGSNPFAANGDEPAVAVHLLRRLRKVVAQLPDSKLDPPTREDEELTAAMKQLRAADLATQRAVYKRDRIENQLSWYERRSGEHKKSAKSWLGTAMVFSALGILAAGFKFFSIEVDLLGVFAAFASSAIAWNQLNQHRNQATAYAVTARELIIIRDTIDQVSDHDWPQFVAESEEAISREHTMWLARHGHLAG
ncbi:DUF4231 domain-containing protein [Pseudonocardia ailaonensis]|uniref:DUF4231 domain-containing protein n=1 Tax=Pseudonocardia ailaonensis TaxID=367279 RepID=A0ABN2MWF8_9PSEU